MQRLNGIDETIAARRDKIVAQPHRAIHKLHKYNLAYYFLDFRSAPELLIKRSYAKVEYERHGYRTAYHHFNIIPSGLYVKNNFCDYSKLVYLNNIMHSQFFSVSFSAYLAREKFLFNAVYSVAWLMILSFCYLA